MVAEQSRVYSLRWLKEPAGDRPMALTPKQRQALVAASHRLKPAVTVGAGNVSDSAVAQVRAAFAGHELIKIRVNADDGPVCDATATDLVQRVPCEVVKRIGRVVLLYCPALSGERSLT